MAGGAEFTRVIIGLRAAGRCPGAVVDSQFQSPIAAPAKTMAKKPASQMDVIVSLCKRRGFVFQASEVYGGLGNTYDYGPLGVELLRRVKDAWWNRIVVERSDVVGLDSAIIQHPKVWETSGHVAGFSDPMVDCKLCKARFRADKLEDSRCPEKPSKRPGECAGELTEAQIGRAHV